MFPRGFPFAEFAVTRLGRAATMPKTFHELVLPRSVPCPIMPMPPFCSPTLSNMVPGAKATSIPSDALPIAMLPLTVPLIWQPRPPLLFEMPDVTIALPALIIPPAPLL